MHFQSLNTTYHLHMQLQAMHAFGVHCLCSSTVQLQTSARSVDMPTPV
jgi:hypothetical protein